MLKAVRRFDALWGLSYASRTRAQEQFSSFSEPNLAYKRPICGSKIRTKMWTFAGLFQKSDEHGAKNGKSVGRKTQDPGAKWNCI